MTKNFLPSKRRVKVLRPGFFDSVLSLIRYKIRGLGVESAALCCGRAYHCINTTQPCQDV